MRPGLVKWRECNAHAAPLHCSAVDRIGRPLKDGSNSRNPVESAMAKSTKKPAKAAATKENPTKSAPAQALREMADPDGKIFVGQSVKPEVLTLALANRHGLVTGATGTGKTVSLQVLAEG